MFLRYLGTIKPLNFLCNICLILFFAFIIYTFTPDSSTLNTQPYGMRDEKLRQEIKDRMIPPSPYTYNLSNPETIYPAQFGQDVELVKIFRNMTDGFFFEAGALDGEALSNTLYLERFLGWRGLLVEPNPVSFATMVTKRRKAYLLQAGVAPSNQSDEITLIKLDEDEAYLSRLLEEGESKPNESQAYTVPCYPFYSIMSALNLPTIDVFILDIEGVEFQILKNIPWSEMNIRVVFIEINHVPEGQDGVTKLMESHGYKFYKVVTIDAVYYRPDLSKDLDFS